MNNRRKNNHAHRAWKAGVALLVLLVGACSSSTDKVEDFVVVTAADNAMATLEKAIRCEAVISPVEAQRLLLTAGARPVVLNNAATPNEPLQEAGIYGQYSLPIPLSFLGGVTSNQVSITGYTGDRQTKAYGLMLMLNTNDEPIELLAQAAGAHFTKWGDYRINVKAHDVVFRREGNHQYLGCQFYYRSTYKWFDARGFNPFAQPTKK